MTAAMHQCRGGGSGRHKGLKIPRNFVLYRFKSGPRHFFRALLKIRWHFSHPVFRPSSALQQIAGEKCGLVDSTSIRRNLGWLIIHYMTRNVGTGEGLEHQGNSAGDPSRQSDKLISA